jgi:hypothetical protein
MNIVWWRPRDTETRVRIIFAEHSRSFAPTEAPAIFVVTKDAVFGSVFRPIATRPTRRPTRIATHARTHANSDGF